MEVELEGKKIRGHYSISMYGISSPSNRHVLTIVLHAQYMCQINNCK